MRPHRRHVSGVLIAGLLATTGLALAPESAVAVDCPEMPCVVITVVSTVDGKTKPEQSRAISATELRSLSADERDLADRKYDLRKNPASKGGKLEEDVAKGTTRVTLNSLLSFVDATLASRATYTETPNASKIPAVLSSADLVDPTPDPATPPPTEQPTSPTPSPTASAAEYPFYEKLEPIVYLTSGNRIGYLRPLRDLDEDTNASDYFQVAGQLDLTVHTTGKLLAPTVTSSAGADLDTGAKTTFSYSYSEKTRVRSTLWDFGDGSTQGTKREKPSKSYAKRGTYPVVVTIRTNDGSYGRSAPVEVKVAKPPKAPSSGTGGGSGLGGSGGSGTSGTTLPPPFDPFEGDVEPPAGVDEPPLQEPDTDPVPVDDGLEPVEGYVLAGAEIVPGGVPESIPGTQESTAPAPATQASTRQRVATWLVAGLAAAALLGLGAASETRWFRHRLRHLRRAA